MSFLPASWAPYLLSLLRIVSSLVFMAHGTQKVLSFPAAPPNGVPPLTSIYGIAGLMEIVGGLLLLFGLFTRPVAFILSGQMAVAYWMSHAPRSLYPILNNGDAAILYCFIFLFIAAAGGGPLGLDGAVKSDRKAA